MLDITYGQITIYNLKKKKITKQKESGQATEVFNKYLGNSRQLASSHVRSSSYLCFYDFRIFLRKLRHD